MSACKVHSRNQIEPDEQGIPGVALGEFCAVLVEKLTIPLAMMPIAGSGETLW